MHASELQARLTESELKTKIIDLAHARGWLAHHTRPARRWDGSWSTPIEGDPGFPDLVLVRDQSIIIVELKTTKGALSDEQRKWFRELTGDGSGRSPHRSAGVRDGHGLLVETWRPEDWALIEEILA